jgi:hypothetical protein
MNTKLLNKLSKRVRYWLNDRLTPGYKTCICWLLGIVGFFAFLHFGDIFPEFREAGWSAIEYAVVALLMALAAGIGRAIYDVVHEDGAFSAVGLAAAFLFLIFGGFWLVSISIKPGFPMYLLNLDKGRGACIVILCSTVYGYFAQKRDTDRLGQADRNRELILTPRRVVSGRRAGGYQCPHCGDQNYEPYPDFESTNRRCRRCKTVFSTTELEP